MVDYGNANILSMHHSSKIINFMIVVAELKQKKNSGTVTRGMLAGDTVPGGWGRRLVSFKSKGKMT